MSPLVTEMMKINFILKSHDFPIPALTKWILSVCLKVHTVQVQFPQQPQFRNEIGRLNRLKKLDVSANDSSKLKEVTLIGFQIKTTRLISS
jgi:hypothetical protein